MGTGEPVKEYSDRVGGYNIMNRCGVEGGI
jgi:hypothetical protein